MDVLDLPVTGREEDAVDGLATLVTTVLDNGGSQVPLTGGISFGLAMEELEEADFWDEHSLDAQRFYSILCWVYGSDPETYETLLDDCLLLHLSNRRRSGTVVARLARSFSSQPPH